MSYPVDTTPYPKVLYSETEGSARVENEAEHEALGDGWQETPFGSAETPAEPVKAKRGRKPKADKAEGGDEAKAE